MRAKLELYDENVCEHVWEVWRQTVQVSRDADTLIDMEKSREITMTEEEEEEEEGGEEETEEEEGTEEIDYEEVKEYLKQ